jgi:hypothetical protein
MQCRAILKELRATSRRPTFGLSLTSARIIGLMVRSLAGANQRGFIVSGDPQANRSD